MRVIDEAVIFAAKALAGQTRRYTGEPSVFHSFHVAQLAAYFGLPEDVQLAAVLHDVLEDSAETAANLEAMFGQQVTDLVIGCTKVSKLTDGSREVRFKIDLEWFAAQCSNVQTLKVIDAISNGQSIKVFDPEFWPVYRREKLELVARLVDADNAVVSAFYAIYDD